MKAENDDPMKGLMEAVEAEKSKMRAHLMSLDEKERFRILREDLSLKSIET